MPPALTGITRRAKYGTNLPVSASVATNTSLAATEPRARNWRGSLLNNIGWTYFDAGDTATALDLDDFGIGQRAVVGQIGVPVIVVEVHFHVGHVAHHARHHILHHALHVAAHGVVVRHADAGYSGAIACAAERGVDLPMLAARP